MNSKFTIDSTTDGGGKLHEAIAGGRIVDVLVNGIPIYEADLSRVSSRSVTLKMGSGTEVEFKSKVTDPYSGAAVEHDSLRVLTRSYCPAMTALLSVASIPLMLLRSMSRSEMTIMSWNSRLSGRATTRGR